MTALVGLMLQSFFCFVVGVFFCLFAQQCATFFQNLQYLSCKQVCDQNTIDPRKSTYVLMGIGRLFQLVSFFTPHMLCERHSPRLWKRSSKRIWVFLKLSVSIARPEQQEGQGPSLRHCQTIAWWLHFMMHSGTPGDWNSTVRQTRVSSFMQCSCQTK